MLLSGQNTDDKAKGGLGSIPDPEEQGGELSLLIHFAKGLPHWDLRVPLPISYEPKQ